MLAQNWKGQKQKKASWNVGTEEKAIAMHKQFKIQIQYWECRWNKDLKKEKNQPLISSWRWQEPQKAIA